MNKRIHDEVKEFDASKQYLQNEKLILPFFTMQEVNNVLQAEVITELKSRVPPPMNATPKYWNFEASRLAQFAG